MWVDVFSCVACDCIIHGEASLEEEESVVVEVALNIKTIDVAASIADVIPADVDHINQPVQPTYEEISMQRLPMAGSKHQVKAIEKITSSLWVASLLANINEPTTIEGDWSGRDAWMVITYRQRI